MSCSVASPGMGHWHVPHGVCECTQILQPFKLWLCLSFCRVSSKLYRQSHQSPENNFLLNFAVRKYRYHRYIGIADILGQKYRYRVTFQIPISRPCPLEQNSGDVTGFVETLQYWFWNNGLLLNSSKSVIVYFGTHGRLRQSYHHSHRS